MVLTWGYQVQQAQTGVPHHPAIVLLAVLPRVQSQQHRSEIRPCLNHKEHIPTGEKVVPHSQRLNLLPRRLLPRRCTRRILKMMSKTNPCCPESLSSCYLFLKTIRLVHCYRPGR